MSQYSQTGQIQQYSNIQPVWKFVFLYIITFEFINYLGLTNIGNS